MDSVLSRPSLNAPTHSVASRAFHRALLYRTRAEYLDAVGGFVSAGLDNGERVLLALPAERLEWIRPIFGSSANVRLVDMRDSGRNPALMIPALRAFIEEAPAVPARVVGEPVWPGRRRAEISEVAETETLVNLAFRDDGVAMLCPYDALRLPAEVLAECCEHNHPAVLGHGGVRPGAYVDRTGWDSWDRQPLDPPPPEAAVTEVGLRGLAGFRRRLRQEALESGLLEGRVEDLLLAVTEVATNALVHGSGRARVRIWSDPEDGALICEVADEGRIDDPLAGRRPLRAEAEGSRGLWLVNQLSDLVQLRSGERGTVVRMRFAVDRP